MNPDFPALLLGRFNARHDGYISDACDGKVYQNLMSVNGFLADPLHILHIYILYIVFKTSNTSVWPVYFIINKLPPNLRYVLPSHTIMHAPLGNISIHQQLQVYKEVHNTCWFVMLHTIFSNVSVPSPNLGILQAG